MGMKNLLIIGARGWGREVYIMAQHCIGYGTEFIIKGFLDDNTDALKGKDGYPPIIDSVENYIPHKDDVFICAMGDPHWKRHYAEIVINKEGRFISLVHKDAYIGQNTKFGKGCIISKGTSISCDIEIGQFVTFQRLVDIGHDACIGDFAHLGTKSFMGGYSKLGVESTLQTAAILLPHIKVSDRCVVGAGSVVIRHVKEGYTVYGNPAKVLKY